MIIGMPRFTLKPPSPTIATTIDVLVDDDCTSTVDKMPVIKPETGLSTALYKLLAPLPPRTLKAEPIKLRPIRKTYREIKAPPTHKQIMNGVNDFRSDAFVSEFVILFFVGSSPATLAMTRKLSRNVDQASELG
jgi:hypothetical protein